MAQIIIDGKGLILGRLGTFAAKQAILGNVIDIVNSESIVVTGHKENIIARFHQKFKRGTYAKGPFYYRRPHFLVRRCIRGMMHHKQGRGRDAFKNIKCHIGVPTEFQNKELKKIPEAHIDKSQGKVSSLSMKQICATLGYKQLGEKT